MLRKRVEFANVEALDVSVLGRSQRVQGEKPGPLTVLFQLFTCLVPLRTELSVGILKPFSASRKANVFED